MRKVLFVCAILGLTVNLSLAQTLREKFRREKTIDASADLVPPAPDYSNLYYWAAHPDKWDYSDSIPAFLTNEVQEASVDVFFLHPTTYTQYFQNADMNADVNDSILNHQTDVRTILYRAS